MNGPIGNVVIQIFETPAPFGGVSITYPFQQASDQQITFGGVVSKGIEAGLRWEYHASITTLRGPGQPSLDAFDFTDWLPSSLIIIVIDPGTGKERQEWLVVAGPGVADNDGHIILGNYDALTNNKHLERVA